MARKVDYYFRETASGLRRNGWVAFGAISTTFVALFLLGLSLLGWREVNLIIDQTAGKIDVVVYLNTGISGDQQAAIQQKLQSLPEVTSVEFVSQAQAYAEAEKIFGPNSTEMKNITPADLPPSFRVNLHDPLTQYDAVNAQMQGVAGIQSIRDNAAFVNTLYVITGWLRWGLLFVAILMLMSSAFLVANTVRMGLFARRREIGIMKLVGATNWFIRVPFMIEGVFEGLVGTGVAILLLWALMKAFITPLNDKLKFFPWVHTGDLVVVIPWMLLAGVGVAAIASFAGMRRFLEV
jgi:cell division transport system permease protein